MDMNKKRHVIRFLFVKVMDRFKVFWYSETSNIFYQHGYVLFVLRVNKQLKQTWCNRTENIVSNRSTNLSKSFCRECIQLKIGWSQTIDTNADQEIPKVDTPDVMKSDVLDFERVSVYRLFREYVDIT